MNAGPVGDARMRFWDSSALVPLLVDEPTTKRLFRLYQTDDEILVWWGTEVECASALARREREATVDTEDAVPAFRRLRALVTSWHEVEPSDGVRETAQRFLRVHDLRASDALQLAAAFVAAESRPPTLELVCLDERLTRAARREGFEVVDGSEPAERGA